MLVIPSLQTFQKIFARRPKMFESLRRASGNLRQSSEIIISLWKGSSNCQRCCKFPGDIRCSLEGFG